MVDLRSRAAVRPRAVAGATTSPPAVRRRGPATRVGRGAVALVVAVLAFSLGAPRAHAVPVAVPIIIGAVTLAYGAYGDYQNDGDLKDATRKILQAIESAKDEIIDELNTIAESEATSCAEARIDQFANIESWTRTTVEIYANEADLCLTKIKNYIRDLSVPKSVDKLGFALNALGPIVLASFARLGWSDTAVIAKLKEGNNKIRTRLEPSTTNGSYPFGHCYASFLRGDAEPGQPVEVHLTCKEYNGDVGTDFTFSNRPLDYTKAKNAATANTSRPVALAALALL
jgi:hypothetical protein